MRLPLPVRAAMAAALLGVGCAQVLGIEEATLDPALGAEAPGAPQLTCESYCELLEKNCTGALQQYAGRETCLSTCAVLPIGTASDAEENTLGCRLRYAVSAGEFEADVNCPAAGPSGNGICGTNCDALCTIALASCDPADTIVKNCGTLCAALPDRGSFDASMDKGRSVQCHIYHATAATRDPSIHCPHAAGVGPCAADLPP
ncbi:MAG: hypothetical protein FJ104_13365 [Deltaproteobacteria bacterium]|nr:hypothetical protein [Deltaproteobacteria bacterium]